MPGLADRHGQHAAAELAHELGLLDGGQEGAGGQQPALGVAPAHERLDAHPAMPVARSATGW